jgi:hypothetical protein
MLFLKLALSVLSKSSSPLSKNLKAKVVIRVVAASESKARSPLLLLPMSFLKLAMSVLSKLSSPLSMFVKPKS